VTSTPTAAPTEPAWTLLYSDNFDSGDLSAWTVGTGWTLIPSEGGQAMQAIGNTEPLTYASGVLSDIAVSARVMLNGGSFSIRLRDNVDGAYIVTFHASGLLC